MFFSKIPFFCYWIIKHSDSLYKTFHEKKNYSSNSNLTIDHLWCNVIKQSVFNQSPTKSQRNNIFWFLFVCYSNVIFFVLIWKQPNSRPLSWLIIVQHAGRDRPSEYRVSNPHTMNDLCRICITMSWLSYVFEKITFFHHFHCQF